MYMFKNVQIRSKISFQIRAFMTVGPLVFLYYPKSLYINSHYNGQISSSQYAISTCLHKVINVVNELFENPSYVL